MATKSKTAPLDAAQAKVNDLDEQERAARAHRDKARAHLADLQNRNQSGDQTVSGLDLMTARAEVEAAEGLADHAARVLAEAQTEAAALLAERTAQEVREGIALHDIAAIAQEAQEAATAALQRLNEALIRRDAASDAAGQKLADAGIMPGEWVNGVRYFPVRFGLGGTGNVMPGQFNVEVQTDDGETAWLSGMQGDRNTRRTLTGLVDDALNNARAAMPVGQVPGSGVALRSFEGGRLGGQCW